MFFSVYSIKQLLQSFSLFLGLSISYNLNDESVLFRDFDYTWLRIEYLDSEDLVSLDILA